MNFRSSFYSCQIFSLDSLTAGDVINQQRRGSSFGFRDSISLPPGSIKAPLQHQISSPYPISASRSLSLQATINPSEPVPVTCRRSYSAKKREGKKKSFVRYVSGTGETRRASWKFFWSLMRAHRPRNTEQKHVNRVFSVLPQKHIC